MAGRGRGGRHNRTRVPGQTGTRQADWGKKTHGVNRVWHMAEPLAHHPCQGNMVQRRVLLQVLLVYLKSFECPFLPALGTRYGLSLLLTPRQSSNPPTPLPLGVAPSPKPQIKPGPMLAQSIIRISSPRRPIRPRAVEPVGVMCRPQPCGQGSRLGPQG